MGSAGFLRLLRSPAKPVRCDRGRAVPTALQLENSLHRERQSPSLQKGVVPSLRLEHYSRLLQRDRVMSDERLWCETVGRQELTDPRDVVEDVAVSESLGEIEQSTP